MRIQEAHNIFDTDTPINTFILNISKNVSCDEGVIVWTCEIHDLHSGERCGDAWFAEHYPMTDITWI